MTTTRNALVTGAGNGIGREISHRLARDGIHVIVADLDPGAAGAVTAAIIDDGGRATVAELDVANSESVAAVVAEIETTHGYIDALVNNAGIADNNVLEDLELSQWDNVIGVNLTGPFLCIKSVAPVMRRNGYGRIVNISSIAAIHGALTCVNYCAAKAGLLGLTVAVAREFGRYAAEDGADMTCNAVLPGVIDTRMSVLMSDALRDERINNTPLNRLGEPGDIADTVAFYASESSRFVTGTSLRVDGGLHMAIG